MSEENVEIIRSLYETVERGDAAAVLAFYHPEVEWDMTRGPLAGLTGWGVYRGHEGLRRFFRERHEAWETPWTMTEEHEAIRRIYEAFGRRDLDRIAAELHDDAVVDFANSVGPESGVYPGVEGIKKLLDLYWEAFEEISIEPEELVDGADGVVALVVARGIGRGSGVSVEARGPHLWCFRDGRAVRFTLYQERAEALKAAGLAE